MKGNPKKSPRKSATRERAQRKRPAKVAKVVDPVAILESIAGNRRLKPTPRVAAAKELVRLRLALLGSKKPASAPAPETVAAQKGDRLAEELNKRALAMMSPKGRA